MLCVLIQNFAYCLHGKCITILKSVYYLLFLPRHWNIAWLQWCVLNLVIHGRVAFWQKLFRTACSEEWEYYEAISWIWNVIFTPVGKSRRMCFQSKNTALEVGGTESLSNVADIKNFLKSTCARRLLAACSQHAFNNHNNWNGTVWKTGAEAGMGGHSRGVGHVSLVSAVLLVESSLWPA